MGAFAVRCKVNITISGVGVIVRKTKPVMINSCLIAVSYYELRHEKVCST